MKKTVLVILCVAMTAMIGCAGDSGKIDEHDDTLKQTENVAEESKAEDVVENVESNEDVKDEAHFDDQLNSDEDIAQESETAELSEEDKAKYMEVYSVVIDRYCDFIKNFSSQEDDAIVDFGGSAGLYDACVGREYEEIMDTVGYTLKDLSGDGVPELVVVDMYGFGGDTKSGKSILGLYSVKNNRPYYLQQGWSRSSFSFMENGEFLQLGSSGAIYSNLATFKIAKDGFALTRDESYYTMEIDGDYDNIGVFDNSENIWNEVAYTPEQADISIDEYNEKRDSYAELAVDFEGTPLSEYANSDLFHKNKESDEPEECKVSAYFEDEYEKLGNEKTLSAINSGSNPLCKTVLVANEDIRDFSFEQLEFVDCDDEGNVKFNKMEIYRLTDFYKGVGFPINITLFGDIPNNGFSYLGDDGLYKHFTISESGFDGSLTIGEYK